jgi:hypothetical protein
VEGKEYCKGIPAVFIPRMVKNSSSLPVSEKHQFFKADEFIEGTTIQFAPLEEFAMYR